MKYFIKANFLIVMSLSILLFTSCETDEGEKVQSDLIGTWTIDESTVDMTIGGVSLVTFLMNTYQASEAEAKAFADIIMAEFESEISGTITFNGDNTYQAKMGDEVENGTWSVSSDGNTLTITGVDDDGTTYSDDLIIVSVSSSMLVVSPPAETEDIDLDDDGVNETTMQIALELTLTK